MYRPFLSAGIGPDNNTWTRFHLCLPSHMSGPLTLPPSWPTISVASQHALPDLSRSNWQHYQQHFLPSQLSQRFSAQHSPTVHRKCHFTSQPHDQTSPSPPFIRSV
ncbi:hypothetical protein B0T16DRAFT_236086 [Cercophora newfieldiana]|uniref:Uncharacterized protein n=1 Tax=Cercophora newfieldiana TaxID=92897 RepID=A0AA39XRT2_9PEZI|nr:hypothetical protein B0T16DRAFT_236086 [Cercophora newfieldiana]